jgi:hypothetical protein
MSHSKVLRQAWKMLWSYRALWIFGIILALTTSGGWSSPPGGDSYERTADWPTGAPFAVPRDEWEGFDFDWPEDYDFQELERMFETWEIPQNIISILIWIGIGLLLLAAISIVARYVAEASLLHMVDDYAKTGKRHSVGKGFRLGWSRTAWRIFLINLLIDLPAMMVSLLLLGLVAAPILTAIDWNATMPSIGRVILSTGLFFPTVILIGIANIVLRLLKRIARRACVVEDLGAVDSISRAFSFVRQNLKDVFITWLINLGVRLGWMIILLPACLLVMVSGGAVAVGGLMILGASWKAVAVAGAIAFFILLIPLLFVEGLVEVFLSSLWTLSYRELLAPTSFEQQDDEPGQELEPAPEQEQEEAQEQDQAQDQDLAKQ